DRRRDPRRCTRHRRVAAVTRTRPPAARDRRGAVMDDRDPVVARALAELPPPPHRPDFWHRLDRALAEAAPPQPATAPAPPPASEPEPADDAEVVVLHRAPADERSARARRAARFPL